MYFSIQDSVSHGIAPIQDSVSHGIAPIQLKGHNWSNISRKSGSIGLELFVGSSEQDISKTLLL